MYKFSNTELLFTSFLAILITNSFRLVYSETRAFSFTIPLNIRFCN
nr:MAG TPA: hypothetical protein [Herelleviridae sp.]